jgi:hypothetical protein
MIKPAVPVGLSSTLPSASTVTRLGAYFGETQAVSVEQKALVGQARRDMRIDTVVQSDQPITSSQVSANFALL